MGSRMRYSRTNGISTLHSRHGPITLGDTHKSVRRPRHGDRHPYPTQSPMPQQSLGLLRGESYPGMAQAKSPRPVPGWSSKDPATCAGTVTLQAWVSSQPETASDRKGRHKEGIRGAFGRCLCGVGRFWD
jgi:hypothetical protein